MSRKLLFIAALLAAGPAMAQSVQQSGNVTRNHVPVWVSSGVVGDGGSSADSPISSLGVTNEGGAGFCISSQRQSAAGRNQLCFGAQTAGPAFLSLQNYGTASPQNLEFIVNGIPVIFPTGGGAFVTSSGTLTPGHVPCFLNSGGVIQDCGLAVSGGTITAGVWQGTPVDIAHGGTGANTAPAAITALGLGTMATQNANSVAVTGGTITGMPSPSAASDVAIKSYVDSTSSGLNILASSALATAAILPNTPTYSNGASGVGATLTAGSSTTLTVDGTVATLNTVVLVKNQASAFQNGIYTVTTAGGGVAWVLTRATYFDQAAEMKAGSYTFVTGGSVNTNSAFTLQSAVTTVGTDALNFAQFSQSGSGTVTQTVIVAGAGLNATGTCTITTTGTCTVSPLQLNVLGRLTLASGVPVMTATSCSGGQCSAQQTLYFAPDGGAFIPVYDGTTQKLAQFTSSATDSIGLTLSMSGSASWPAASCFDVFYANVSGVLYFGTGPAWSTCAGASAARGYSLAKYNGVPVNAATMTLRYGAATTVSVPANQATYLGTVATDASAAGQVTWQFGTAVAGGGQAIHNVWNYWDRKLVTTNVNGLNNATFSSQIAAGYKACFDSATYRVTFLSGLADDAQFFSQNFYGGATNNTGANGATTAAGFIMDSYANPLLATTLDLYINNENYSTNSSASAHSLFGTYTYQPLIGQHFVQCFVGNDGPSINSTFQVGGGVGNLQMQFRM